MGIFKVVVGKQSGVGIADIHHLKRVSGYIARCKEHFSVYSCFLDKEVRPPGVVKVQICTFRVKQIVKESGCGIFCDRKGIACDNIKALVAALHCFFNISIPVGKVTGISRNADELDPDAETFLNSVKTRGKSVKYQIAHRFFNSELVVKLKVFNVVPCKNTYCGTKIHIRYTVLNKGRCCFIDISVYCCRYICCGFSALRRLVNACCKRQNQQHRRHKRQNARYGFTLFH